MDLEMLQERAEIIRRVRSFFDGKGCLELDTPLLSPDLIPESCLEVFETSRILPSGSAAPYWLVPSPEIWMKKIIARHRVDVYQICKCFRNGESSGFLHSPEFTMLEYYTMNAGYMDSLELTEELFRFLAPSRFSLPFERLTVAEAFARYAGFDLFAAAAAQGGLEAEARRLGLYPQPCLETTALYDLIFIHAVEPRLKHGRPVALLDYPAFVPCLARRNGETVERWELYCDGIELANCYTEETDAGRVRGFFESETAAKEKQALVRHRVDRDYWKLFGGDGDWGMGTGDWGLGTGDWGHPSKRARNVEGVNGQMRRGERPNKSPMYRKKLQAEGTGGAGSKFPACSGVALGLDRLIMALCGRSTIDAVLPFPMDN
ncbi:MAG: LysR family transcriptional regulator [Treponema sp.]|jgi:lysyl-tRNA synthetase class 2|nr:LysR family transcriptional regulator [Treponema sp.]